MADKDTKNEAKTETAPASSATNASSALDSFVDKYGGPAQHKAHMKGELAHVKADKPESLTAFCDAFANTMAKHRAMEKDLKALLGVTD